METIIIQYRCIHMPVNFYKFVILKILNTECYPDTLLFRPTPSGCRNLVGELVN